MTHHDIIDSYADYSTGRLSTGEQQRVDSHLATCDSCRTAYGLLRSSLEPAHASQRLIADPYLPTRIRAHVDQRQVARTFAPAVQWSLASLALGLAVTLGILLGSDLPSARATTLSSTTIVDEFASSLTSHDLSDKWYAAVNTSGEDQR